MDTSLHPNDAFAGFGKAARTAFMLERDYAHLNHGSYGATPVSVLAAQRVWQDRLELEPSRFMRREYKPAMRAAAEALAPRLGVEADGVVLVENVTQAVNAILRELQLPAGAGILITDQTYGAVRNAVRHNCKRNGWILRDVALPFPVASAEEILAAFKAALTPAPALVIIDHVTSPTALVMPLAEMAAAAREAGALVLVDGAHAPGMLDLDIDPKMAWAIRHPERFPVDLNRAPKEMLLRVPGLGVRNVKRVLMARRHGRLRVADIARLKAPMSKLLPFVLLADHHPRKALDDPAALRAQLAPPPRQGSLFDAPSAS